MLVTSGPTHEAVDPVRFLGNRSSGKMGHAVARAAWRRGAQVTLVTGPTSLDDPAGVMTVHVERAVDMEAAVKEHIGDADVVVFAAAVADFRPAVPKDSKLKRTRDDVAAIPVTENPDIAAGTRDRRKPGAFVVGFALETENVEDNARGKLAGKGLDLIVANDATEEGAGFGVDTNRVTMIDASSSEVLPMMSKDAVAEALLDRVSPRP